MNLVNSIIPGIKNTKPKVCIAVPTKDMMYSHFAFCLQELVQYNTRTNIETVVEFNLGTLISNQRENLVHKAQEHDATHILWLDSDMMFPKNLCETLLAHDENIIACNYSTRALPFKAVGYSTLHDWNSGIPKETTGIVEVAGIGFGCVLTRIEIYQFIEKPWFPITYSKNTNDYLGEDMNFCQKAVAEGYSIMVDCDLSRFIYHIGSAAYLWNKQIQE
jgi:hypothetical protein